MNVPFRRSRRRALAALLAAVLVAACGSPPPATVTVEGVVRSPIMGPLAGVIVHLAGTTTATDATGGFRVEGVRLPYDVMLGSSSPEPWVAVFEGLADPAPVLAPMPPTVAPFEAHVTGHTWNGLPMPDGWSATVCVEGRLSPVFGCAFASAGDATYSLEAMWFGPVTVPVRIHMLWSEVDADGLPFSTPARGSYDGVLTQGEPRTYHPMPSQSPVNAELTAQIAVAGGGTPWFTVVGSGVSEHLSMPVYAAIGVVGSLVLAVPELPAARYEVMSAARFADLTSTAWRVTDDPTEPIDVLVPAPPQQLAPADGAVVAVGTEFAVVGGPGAVRTYRWRPDAATDGPSVWLTTASDRVTVPDVALVGQAWPSGGAYAWSVASGCHAGVDEAAADPDLGWALHATGGFRRDRDGCATVTEEREMTWAP